MEHKVFLCNKSVSFVGGCGVKAFLCPSPSNRRGVLSVRCRSGSSSSQDKKPADEAAGTNDQGADAAASLPTASSSSSSSSNEDGRRRGARVKADTTDWIASSLTRRFGLGAGLAWVGFLAFGVVSEQIKTRREVFMEEQGTRDVDRAEEVVLPSKVRYMDERIGGGTSPVRGDLVVVDLEGKIRESGVVFVNRPSMAFVFGRKPYVGGMCAGLEAALASMRVGGKRHVSVPPEMGFGDAGEDLGGGARVPPNATLDYDVVLRRVSISPS